MVNHSVYVLSCLVFIYEYRSCMKKYTIPNLQNACRVLKHLAAIDHPMGVGELSEQLEVPRTTMLRIVSTLEEEGLIVADNRRYQLGALMAHLGARAMDNVDVRRMALPILKELSNNSRETSHIASRVGTQVMILEVCDSPNPVRAASRAGSLADIHCSATGKVYLAYDESADDSLLKEMELKARTQHTMTSIDQVLAETEKTRAQGFALDDEEYAEGVRCLAAPVYDAQGQLATAIGITASTMTFPRERIQEIANNVCIAARKLSKNLGAQ